MTGALQQLLSDHHQLIETLRLEHTAPDQLLEVFAAAEVFADQLGQSTPSCREALLALVREARVSVGQIELTLDRGALCPPDASLAALSQPDPINARPMPQY